MNSNTAWLTPFQFQMKLFLWVGWLRSLCGGLLDQIEIKTTLALDSVELRLSLAIMEMVHRKMVSRFLFRSLKSIFEEKSAKESLWYIVFYNIYPFQPTLGATCCIKPHVCFEISPNTYLIQHTMWVLSLPFSFFVPQRYLNI